MLNTIFSSRQKPFIIICALGCILYFQVLFFDFSYLDDNALILDSQVFLSSLSNIPVAFQTDVFHSTNLGAFYYRPLLTISFMLDYQIGKDVPFIYHLDNLVLHVLATCLVFVFLKKLDYRKESALLFSLVFLVHPVLSQAVAWVPGRNDSLLAIFILLATTYFLDYLQTGSKKKRAWCLVFFAASIFTKESALMLLPFLVLYFYHSRKKNGVHLVRELSPFMLWSLGIVVAWFIARHNALAGSVGMTLDAMARSVWSNLPALVQFLGKIFFPFNLTVLPIIRDTTFWYGTVALSLLLALVLFSRQKRWDRIMFGLGWFVVFLLPSFIRPNPDVAADFIEHRLYVPIVGMFIVLLETDVIKKIDVKKRIHVAIALCILTVYGAVGLVHVRVFSDRISFWQDAANHSPHYPLAHRNLGAMLYLDGELDGAEVEFKKTLALNPGEQMAHNNLGLIYMQQKEFERAEEEFKKEIEINPYYDAAHFNLGLLYSRMERFDEAIAQWKKTLEINPTYSDALYALAELCYRREDYRSAAGYANEIRSRGLPVPPEWQKLSGRGTDDSLRLKKLP